MRLDERRANPAFRADEGIKQAHAGIADAGIARELRGKGHGSRAFGTIRCLLGLNLGEGAASFAFSYGLFPRRHGSEGGGPERQEPGWFGNRFLGHGFALAIQRRSCWASAFYTGPSISHQYRRACHTGLSKARHRLGVLWELVAEDEARLTTPLPPMPLKHWWRFFRRIGLPHLSFHSTRVTVARRLCQAGIHKRVVMKSLGHASATVHRIYRRA